MPPAKEELINRLSKKRRYSLKRNMEKLKEKGEVKIKDMSAPEHIKDGLDILIKLHQKRWNALGRAGCFSSSKFLKFHQELMKILSDKKRLRLNVLEEDKKPVAAVYDFCYEGKV